ncbi:MAG: NAD-dependent epimerase/dehydratase family protein [Ginsengibacter sp.]
MILVTGGSGLVGSELISQLLERGEEIIAIHHNSPLQAAAHTNLRTIECDILDTSILELAMAGAEQVYHCAAAISFHQKDVEKLFNINVRGTANVVNAAIDAGVRKIVHVSSVSALGRIRNDQIITEDMNWTEKSSNSEYGKSKYFGEMEVWRGAGEGLQVVVVNPSTILGAGDWNQGSSEIFKSVYKEFPWYSDGISGFVDVKDVAKAMILLMNSEISHERYILNSENTSFKNVFTEIAKCFGKKLPVKKVTPLLAEMVWRWEALSSRFSGKDPMITRETARTALASVYFDNTKILKALPGFQFLPVNDSIRQTCATFQEKYHL